jgi:hypothetical protein
MADQADWQRLADSLRELHRALMERARRDYEREHPGELKPAELLQLLATSPYFEWLRGLSELTVDVDAVRDSGPRLMDELSTAVRPAVEHFIAVPKESEPANAFAQRYWLYVRDDPNLAAAHASVRQALAAWSRPVQEDAASLLHARHLLTERARHRARGA